MRVQVKDFMSSPVITAVETTKIAEIKSLMTRHGIHAIPIIRYDKKLPKVDVVIKGIVTSTDLGRKIDDASKVADIMTSKVHVIHKHSSAKAAANMMLRQHVHHLVVMEDGEIIGMISSLDFVRLVSEHSLD